MYPAERVLLGIEASKLLHPDLRRNDHGRFAGGSFGG